MKTKIIHLAIEPITGCPMLQLGLEWYLRHLDSAGRRQFTFMFLTQSADGWYGGSPNEKREPDLLFRYDDEERDIVLHYNGGSFSRLPRDIDQGAFAEHVLAIAKLS